MVIGSKLDFNLMADTGAVYSEEKIKSALNNYGLKYRIKTTVYGRKIYVLAYNYELAEKLRDDHFNVYVYNNHIEILVK